jgi:hypothetical protein
MVEPHYPGEIDLCARFGLACHALALDPTSHAGTCGLPVQGEACAASPGCAPGYACSGGAAGGTCAQTCVSTTDCTQTDEVCVLDAASGAHVCQPDACGSALYAPCDVTDAGPGGTCLPAPPGQGTAGLCHAAGTASLTGPCSSSRTPGGAPACPVGTTCMASYAGSACFPVCDPSATAAATDGGPAGCSGVCAPLWKSGPGACLTACTKSADCPQGMRCATLPTYQTASPDVQGCTY